jgi:uncharacterized protein (UPF0333 family)
MRGQAAIEYFVIIGIVIVAITIVAGLAWQQNETSTRVQQANIAANKIASAANSLYAQGPGARASITVVMPSGYSSSRSSVQDNVITLSVFTPDGYMDVIVLTKANISGSPPTSSGLKIIELETIEGYVNITGS